MGKRDPKRPEKDEDREERIIVNRLLADLHRSNTDPSIIAGTPTKQPGSGAPVKRHASTAPIKRPGSALPIKPLRVETPVWRPKGGPQVKRPSSATPVKRPSSATQVKRPGSATQVKRPSSATQVKRPSSTTARQTARQKVSGLNILAPSVQEQQLGVGYDIRVIGKIGRILIGGALVLGPLWVMLTGTSWWFKAQIALGFAATFAAYWVAYRVLGESVLKRTSPWVGMMLLVVAPVALIVVLVPELPVPLWLGIMLYVGVGLIVNVVTNYGGCEVLALQSLMYRRWYKVYSPINVLDAVEDAVVGTEVRPSRPLS
jgi:hypothetical protein